MTFEDGISREDTPLLDSSQLNSPAPARNHKSKTVFCCLTVMVFISMSYAFIEAPMYRLYEIALCKDYYKEHDPSVIGRSGEIPEEKCKVDSIQQDLAMLLTKQVQINLWASLLASVYTRALGRKKFLKLNISCHLCAQLFIFFCLWYENFPVEVTLLSSTFLLVACGQEMRQETIFMVIADATQEDERFTVFTLGQIIVLPPAFVAKRLSAKLMAHDLQTPIILGLTAILLVLVIIWFTEFEVLTAINVDATQTDDQTVQDQPASATCHVTESPRSLQSVIRQNKETFQVLCLSRSIFFLTCTFLATSIFGQLMAGTVFLQNVEEQLGFDLAEASKLQSNSDLMNMISLMITFAVCGKLNAAVLGRFGLWLKSNVLKCTDRVRLLSVKDIVISQFCAVMMTLGFVVIGIAHNYGSIMAGLLLCAAGQAFRMSTRSSLTSMVKEFSEDNTTGLYTIMYYLDLVGGALINSLLAFSFAQGLRWKGPWIGLPFFCSATIWILVTMTVFSVKIPLKE